MVEQVRRGEREEGDLARFIARLWGNEIGMINPNKDRQEGDIENHEQLEELIFNVAKTENWSEKTLKEILTGMIEAFNMSTCYNSVFTMDLVTELLIIERLYADVDSCYGSPYTEEEEPVVGTWTQQTLEEY